MLVKILASGFNHRDVFQRQSLYPGTIFTDPKSNSPSILGADCVGVVVSPPDHTLHNRRVLVAPAENWLQDPLGPDVEGKQFGILGSVKQTRGRGTYAEYIAVHQDDVVECPKHLAESEAAAVPLGALTAYRSVAPCIRVLISILLELTPSRFPFPFSLLLRRDCRAVFTKANVKKGDNVLITGIGGGVAILALQFCVAAGEQASYSCSRRGVHSD